MEWLIGPLNNVFSVLNSNQIVSSVISLFLILYAGLAAPKLHPSMAGLFKNTWFKIIIITLVIYMIMKKDAGTAVLLSVCFVLSLQTINKLTTKKVLNKQNNTAEKLAKEIVNDAPIEFPTETVTESPTESPKESPTESPTESPKLVEEKFSNKCEKDQMCYKYNNRLGKEARMDGILKEGFANNSCSGTVYNMKYAKEPRTTFNNDLIKRDDEDYMVETDGWTGKPSISYTGPCESEHASFVPDCTKRFKGLCVERFGDGPDNTCTEVNGPYKFVKSFTSTEGVDKETGVLPPESSVELAADLNKGKSTKCGNSKKSLEDKLKNLKEQRDSEVSSEASSDESSDESSESEESQVGGGGSEDSEDSEDSESEKDFKEDGSVYTVTPIEYDLLTGEKWERPMHDKSYKDIRLYDLKKKGIGPEACASKPSGFADAFDNNNLDAEVVKGSDGKECEYGCNPYKNKKKELNWK